MNPWQLLNAQLDLFEDRPYWDNDTLKLHLDSDFGNEIDQVQRSPSVWNDPDILNIEMIAIYMHGLSPRID